MAALRQLPSRRQFVPRTMPAFLDFMHPSLVSHPPESDLWLHEIKFDGYRVQIRVEVGQVKVFTRNGHDWADTRFPRLFEIEAEAAGLPDCILDGELCYLGDDGQSNFSGLLTRLTPVRTRDLVVMVFDILWRGDDDLRGVDLVDRKTILAGLLDGLSGDRLRPLPHFEIGGRTLLQAACQIGLEGVVSKRKRSGYKGERTELWLKAKCRPGQEIVIGGWRQEPSRAFKALLAGVYDRGELRYAGSVKTGFKGSSDLLTRLRPLEIPRSPFGAGDPPRKSAEIHWVEPRLVANVEIAEWTDGLKLRQASFKGLREDKDPTEVQREVALGDRTTKSAPR